MRVNRRIAGTQELRDRDLHEEGAHEAVGNAVRARSDDVQTGRDAAEREGDG